MTPEEISIYVFQNQSVTSIYHTKVTMIGKVILRGKFKPLLQNSDSNQSNLWSFQDSSGDDLLLNGDEILSLETFWT